MKEPDATVGFLLEMLSVGKANCNGSLRSGAHCCKTR